MDHPKRARSGKPPTQPREEAYVNSSNLQNALQRIRQAASRDKELRFTALWHHVYDVDRLREAYFGLKRKAAPGVDGETWQHYGENLEENLSDLSDRLRRGAYRAKPVKRAYIPKPDGRQRPLGVTTLEDKLVQRATVEVLSAIYETDFKGFSYGFRPGRSPHDALDALAVGIRTKKVNWVLDADICGFFDAIDHKWLLKFIEHRIADQRVIRHIKKWLNAGVLEDGQRTQLQEGSPQGSSISPLLSNIYLHYVFDLWADQWRQRQGRGDVVIVRFADDFVVGFQYRQEAEQFLKELQERFQKFNLKLHATKTRLIEFGRQAARDRKRRGDNKPETFDFLGFTHVCDRDRLGRFIVLRQTMRKRMRAKLKELKEELRRRMHWPIPVVGQWLRSVLLGHYRYYGVPRNLRKLGAFRHQVSWLWLRTLRRRSQRHRLTPERKDRLVKRWIPSPRVFHPYPEQRLAVIIRGRSPVR
ncbi:MAG: group II intron reverse transcriptase/maturase [Proteobacteria bacterium]|nr:group II intron reverse transcriptase/maturase [Pseudomonadota bacterium]